MNVRVYVCMHARMNVCIHTIPVQLDHRLWPKLKIHIVSSQGHMVSAMDVTCRAAAMAAVAE